MIQFRVNKSVSLVGCMLVLTLLSGSWAGVLPIQPNEYEAALEFYSASESGELQKKMEVYVYKFEDVFAWKMYVDLDDNGEIVEYGRPEYSYQFDGETTKRFVRDSTPNEDMAEIYPGFHDWSMGLFTNPFLIPYRFVSNATEWNLPEDGIYSVATDEVLGQLVDLLRDVPESEFFVSGPEGPDGEATQYVIEFHDDYRYLPVGWVLEIKESGEWAQFLGVKVEYEFESKFGNIFCPTRISIYDDEDVVQTVIKVSVNEADRTDKVDYFFDEWMSCSMIMDHSSGQVYSSRSGEWMAIPSSKESK